MSNRFDDLVPCHAVLQRLLEVERQLVRPVKRNETGDSNEAAVTGFQARSFPHVAEQNLVCILRQRGCDVAKCLASVVWHNSYSFALVCCPARYCSSVTFPSTPH